MIEVENKPVLSHIIDAFPTLKRVIFICNEKDLQNKTLDLKNKLLDIKGNATILSVMPHKKGPVFSLLQINDELDPNLKT